MNGAARPVLVVSEQVDAATDMVVDELNMRDIPVIRLDAERFPQHLTLAAEHGADSTGWRGTLDDGRRPVRLEDVRAVYYRRPGRSHIADSVEEPYRLWARDQADAAFLNILSALPARWMNNPHADRYAAHKPIQVPTAARCGLSVPRSLITNDPLVARDFVRRLPGPAICKPVLSGRLPGMDGRRRMVPTHRVEAGDLDESVRLTAHYFQEEIEKDHEVRLTVVGGQMFGCVIRGTSDAARTDWRTDYEGLEYATTAVPAEVAAGVTSFMAGFGLVYGAFDFAVTPSGEWVFFECNPTGTWAWVENRTGLPIAAAHADHLGGRHGG